MSPNPFRAPLLLSASVLFSLVQFTHAADISQEYDQVRRIALRDPRVREAYEKANERLQEKIVEIDPTLKAYAASRRMPSPEELTAPAPQHPAGMRPFNETAQSSHQEKPERHETAPSRPEPPAPPKKIAAAAPAPQPVHHHAAPAPAPAYSEGRTHVVAPGETIAAIASRYHVSVAALETANNITDPRKLQAGQTILIPGGSGPVAEPAPVHHTATPAAQPQASAQPSSAPADPPSDGIWDRLKRSF